MTRRNRLNEFEGGLLLDLLSLLGSLLLPPGIIVLGALLVFLDLSPTGFFVTVIGLIFAVFALVLVLVFRYG